MSAASEEIERYRALGFFRGADGDAAIRRALARSAEDAALAPRVRAMLLLGEDRARVWWADAECDAFEGNDRYVEWGRALSALGGRRAAEVAERWHPDDGRERRVEISLRLGPRRVRALAHDLGDYVDVATLVEALNRLRPWTRRRLYAAQTQTQDVFLVLLSPRELRGLRAMGWSFAEPPTGRARWQERVVAWWRAFWWPFTVGR